MTPLFFILAALGFGFVIFIHELGHFLFAKWAGVKVEVFSIGFGPRLLTRRIGETEYSISLLPLGGYVKMTGQEDLPEDPKDPETLRTAQDPRSFLVATPGWKALILLGGVLFNFISSYAILLGLALYGLPVLRPVVGEVQTEVLGVDERRHPSPAAEMGLQPGDLILSINGEKVRSFEDLATGAIVAGRKPVVLTISRPGIADPLTLPAEGTVTATYDSRAGRSVLGIDPPESNRLAAFADAPTPVAGAPVPGERVVAIAGAELPPGTTGQEIRERLYPYFGTPVKLGVVDEHGTRRDTAVVVAPGGGASCSLGLPVRISEVTAGSAAAEIGLAAGDVIVSIDDVPLTGVEHFFALVRTAMQRSGTCTLVLLRPDGARITATLTGRELAGRRRIGAAVQPVTSGRLPLIAPALDGKPSALAAANVAAGDTLLSLEADPADPLRSTATLVTGGSRVVVPVTAAARTAATHGRTTGKIGRLFGDRGETSLADQLAGTRVEAHADPDNRPTGAPAPGLLVVKGALRGPRTIDLRPLGEGLPGLLAALQPGDWIVGLGNDGWELVRGAAPQARTATLQARLLGPPLAFEIEFTPYRLDGVGEAFAIANHATHTMVWKSLQFIPKFFQSAEQGGLDAKKSLQGPIGIFDTLRQQAQHHGFFSFLNLVALVGLNLVLVNLLPIPITDGGQLVFLAIETATGKPVSPLVRTIAMWIGLGLVVALMLFVTTLDIVRRI